MYLNKSISLVIPCLNEEKGLESLLSKRPDFIDEVIVVDNDSEDQTAAIARKYGARVVYLKEKDYGLAYRLGLPLAQGDIIVMMDGDDTYPVEEVEKFLRKMKEGDYSFVSGCRFPLKDKHVMPYIKQAQDTKSQI